MSANNQEDRDDQSPQESSDDTSSVESHTSSEPFLKNYMNLDEFLQAKGLNIGLPRRSCIIINTNKQLTGGNGVLQINQQGDEGDDRSAVSDDMASNSSEESVSSNFFVPHSHSLNLVGNNGDNAMSSGSGYASSFSSGGNGSISGYISSSSANSATSTQTGHHSKDKKKNDKSKTHGFSSDSGNGSSVCSSIKMEDSDERASSPEDPFQGVTMSSEDGSVSSLPANPALRRTNTLVRKRLQEKLSQGPISNQAGNSSSSDDSTSSSAPVFYFDYQAEPAAKKRKRTIYHPGPPVKKSTKIHVPEEKKDAKYWERRQKNNLAAKRSREARRKMEMEIARRAQLLEDENKSLRDQVSNLRGKLDELRDRLTEKGDTDLT